MTKLTKHQEKLLASMPTWDEVQREYFVQYPERLQEYKQSILSEYENDPTMSFHELLSIFSRIAEIESYTKFAKRTKISREHLYRALGPKGNPTLATLTKLADSCGLRIGFYLK